MRTHNQSIQFLFALSLMGASVAHAQSLPPSAVVSPAAKANAVAPALPASVTRSSAVALEPAAGEPAAEQSPPSDQQQAKSIIKDAMVGLGLQENQVFSYGTSTRSILFLPDQITSMKDAISTLESKSGNAANSTLVAPTVVNNPTPQAEVGLNEPSTYPVFFLSSIVYNSPNDWSIWMGGEKITSYRNETEVEVVSVTRDSATFRWKPAYITAIAQRQQADAFAPTDEVKNKLSANHSVSYNEERGDVTFTLRQNQSFAVGYFKLFEGYIASPTMGPLPVVNIATEESITAVSSSAPTNALSNRARQLMRPPSTSPNNQSPPSAAPAL